MRKLKKGLTAAVLCVALVFSSAYAATEPPMENPVLAVEGTQLARGMYYISGMATLFSPLEAYVNISCTTYVTSITATLNLQRNQNGTWTTCTSRTLKVYNNNSLIDDSSSFANQAKGYTYRLLVEVTVVKDSLTEGGSFTSGTFYY